MKISLIAIVLLILIVECTTTTETTIDGCQYIVSTSSTGNGPVESMTHKGNCNNPVHKQKHDTIYINELKIK